jgi:hypothetical protein
MPQYVEVNGNVVEFPDGMAAPEIESAIKANYLSIKPAAAVQAGKELNSIPRQLGLTARYGMEGLANTAQLATEPIRAVTDRLFGQTGKTVPLGTLATQFADKIGLPSPQGADERVIGDATRLVAGAGGLGGASSLARNAPGVLGQAGQFLSANMPQQLASAAGAGLAGGASREAGGNPLMQGAASLAGGVAGGMVPGAVQGVANGARTMFNRLTPQEMDTQISAVLNRAGYDYSQVPERVRQSLRTELQTALQAGRELDPAAVARMADFRTIGATPTRGMVTRDPGQFTREMNLAKTGANSSDEGMQGLARLQQANNQTFIRNLNDTGAGRGSLQAAGEQVSGSVLGQQAALRGAETAAWNEARGSAGYRQPIEANVVSRINQALGDDAMMPFLNPTISRYMEAFQTGQQPFTPQAYRNLQSMLSNEMSKGGNEAAAAGLARRVLEQTDLRPITNPRGLDLGNSLVTQGTANAMRAADAAPGQAIDAVNRARSATRAAYAYEDSSPLVRSVLSDGASGDPMRIAQRFVVGGTPNEAEMLAREVGPAGRGPIRDAIAAHLKEKALSGASDEVGAFSQAAYNKALQAIGERKLSLFFSPEEVAQLRALGRVASYAQAQPVGSAVNNSNSGALLLGRGLDAITGLARRVPGGQAFIADPIRNIQISMQNRQAQNVVPSLLAQQPKQPAGAGLLLPGLAYGGLLATP